MRPGEAAGLMVIGLVIGIWLFGFAAGWLLGALIP